MKIYRKIIFLLGITSYCISINFLYLNRVSFNHEFSKAVNNNPQLTKTLNLLENAFQSEKVSLGFKIITYNFIKIHPPYFLGLCKFWDIALINNSSNYIELSKYLFYSFNKTDIIFPFHYFW